MKPILTASTVASGPVKPGSGRCDIHTAETEHSPQYGPALYNTATDRPLAVFIHPDPQSPNVPDRQVNEGQVEACDCICLLMWLEWSHRVGQSERRKLVIVSLAILHSPSCRPLGASRLQSCSSGSLVCAAAGFGFPRKFPSGKDNEL